MVLKTTLNVKGLFKSSTAPLYRSLVTSLMLNLPQHQHRLLLTTRIGPLDIGYMNASADTVVPWIASGQRSSSPRVCY